MGDQMVVPSAQAWPDVHRSDCRAFVHGLLGAKSMRRTLLRHWQRGYPVDRKRTPQLRDVWADMLARLLYNPVALRLRHDHLCLLDGPAFNVRYEWLRHASLRGFVQHALLPHAAELFARRVTHKNGEFDMSGFVYDPRAGEDPHLAIVDPVWRRQLTLDFVLLVVAAEQWFWDVELLAAVQDLQLNHAEGRADPFLIAVHQGLQHRCVLAEVPAWGLEPYDVHPEDAHQRREKQKKVRTR